MNEINGRAWPDGSGDLADPLRIDGLIDDVVAGRLSGARTAKRPRAGAPAGDEELVTALSGLTVIDWPADEAGDRIAQAVAFAADRNEPGALAAPDSYRPIRSGRQRPAGWPRWAVAGVTAAAAAAAILVVATAPFGSPHQGTSGRAAAPATGQPGSGRSGRAAPAAHDLPMRLVDSVTSPFRTAGTGPTRALECVTASVCYAWNVGPHGNEVERTSDGGTTWRLVAAVPRQLTLSMGNRGNDNYFSCPTAEICIAPAGGLRLIVTRDGGAHWSIRTVPAPGASIGAVIDQVSCPTAENCVAHVSDDGAGTFLATTNGGRTWTGAAALPAGAPRNLWHLRCDRSGHCIGLEPTGTRTSGGLSAIRSADEGRTWTVSTPTRLSPTAILLLSCGDGLHCMAVTGNGITMTTTSDGGVTWRTTVAPSSWPNTAADLSCPTGQDCFIAAADTLPPVHGVSYGYRNPVVEATHDGGRTWAPLSLPVVKPAPLADVYPLSCPSADGCIAGAATARGKFANGGLILSSFPRSG